MHVVAQLFACGLPVVRVCSPLQRPADPVINAPQPHCL